MQQIIDAYDARSSYTDTGTAFVTFHAASPPLEARLEFSTAFSSPDEIRFEFAPAPDNTAQAFATAGAIDSAQDLADMRGPSLDAAAMIPPLLLAMDDAPLAGLTPTGITRTKESPPTWLITAQPNESTEASTTRYRIWINPSSKLIRRIERTVTNLTTGPHSTAIFEYHAGNNAHALAR